MKNKKHLFLIAMIPVFMSLIGCKQETYYKVNKIADYIFETETYTSLDYDFADAYFEKNYDNWGGGCSAVSKMIDGHMTIGRNMDLNISNKCAYVVRTKANLPDEYDTIGLAYTFRDVSPDYSEVLAHNGINEEWHKLLPFMCDDVLNSEGLHIEINMRHAEFWPNGEDKFSCDHTCKNPDVRRIYMFEIPRYIGTHCATVEEACQMLLNGLDIYNKPGYWNYAFIISDASGTSVLAELAYNKIYLTGQSYGVVAQTNFYRNEEFNAIEDTQSGLGRLDYMLANIDAVSNETEMYYLMKDINYFQFYFETCKFDRRSELIGELGYLTKDYVYNQLSPERFQFIVNEIFGVVSEFNREELRMLNSLWETTFTEVVDCYDKEIKVKIYEKIKETDEDPTYLRIAFDKTYKYASEDELFG